MLKSRPRLIVVLHLAALLILTCPEFALSQATPVPTFEERDRGIALYQQSQFVEAAEVLQKAVKKNRTDDQGWYFLGLALLQQPKEAKDASKALEMAVKLKPDFALARAALGYSLLRSNKSSEAVREANAALKSNPNIVDAHYVLAVVGLRTGKREVALQEAETIIRLDPKVAVAYLLKSQALTSYLGDALTSNRSEPVEIRQARYVDAADALEKFLQLAPNTRDKQTWNEQLESLRFHSAPSRKSAGIEVFSGRDVTTKARVLQMPEPQYTEEARSNRVKGTVILRAVFAADGTVKHFLVISGLPDGLTESSIRAARKIKFTPAVIDGRPVSMFIQLEYNFDLD